MILKIVTFILIVIVFHHYISLFFHSFFLHRYGTHKQFIMSRKWEKRFFILTYLTQGSSFLNPRTYAIMHSEHHKHSDTKDDPHSPLNFSVWRWGLDFPIAVMKMMKRTKEIFYGIYHGKSVLISLYKDKRFPTWPEFEKFASGKLSAVLFTLVYIAIYYFFAPVWWLWFLLPYTILSGPFQGAVVNWVGHMWGLRPFKDTNDNSRNFPLLDFIMLGETNQNNHHNNQFNPNFARKWYEFDGAYRVIQLFLKWGIIRINPNHIAL